MKNNTNAIAGKAQVDNPRTVSRGLKLQSVFLGIDSLYLVLEYPYADIYHKWSKAVNSQVSRGRLHEGIIHNDKLVRRGGLGYKYSVWYGDARIFITDRVEEYLMQTKEQGQGMGIMLQLGPKWLISNVDWKSDTDLIEKIYALLDDFGIYEPSHYRVRINRIDVALDMSGCPTDSFSIDEWKDNWIGYSKKKDFHVSSQTGNFSGFSIGSSEGAVRFKAYDKTLQSIADGDLNFWWSVWLDRLDNAVGVTRFEWSIKVFNAKFQSMQYLTDYTFEGLKEIVNYASLKWGRLCIPSNDTNKTRWELAPMWEEVRRLLVEEWEINLSGYAKRQYDVRPDLNPAYLRSMAGWLAGYLARLGISRDLGRPEEIVEALNFLEREVSRIYPKAEHKWRVFSLLKGTGDDLWGNGK